MGVNSIREREADVQLYQTPEKAVLQPSPPRSSITDAPSPRRFQVEERMRRAVMDVFGMRAEPVPMP